MYARQQPYIVTGARCAFSFISEFPKSSQRSNTRSTNFALCKNIELSMKSLSIVENYCDSRVIPRNEITLYDLKKFQDPAEIDQFADELIKVLDNAAKMYENPPDSPAPSTGEKKRGKMNWIGLTKLHCPLCQTTIATTCFTRQTEPQICTGCKGSLTVLCAKCSRSYKCLRSAYRHVRHGCQGSPVTVANNNNPAIDEDKSTAAKKPSVTACLKCNKTFKSATYYWKHKCPNA
ncbi:hypothetical protein TKK_0011268 [Trichogramma kaykai]